MLNLYVIWERRCQFYLPLLFFFFTPIAALWQTELQANPAATGHLLPGLCQAGFGGRGRLLASPGQSSLFTAHCWDSPGERQAGSRSFPSPRISPSHSATGGMQAIKHNIWSCSVMAFANSVSCQIFDNCWACLSCLWRATVAAHWVIFFHPSDEAPGSTKTEKNVAWSRSQKKDFCSNSNNNFCVMSFFSLYSGQCHMAAAIKHLPPCGICTCVY